ncbi:MAG: hypothetical protein ACLR6B_06820 [Blautia sp.]
MKADESFPVLTEKKKFSVKLFPGAARSFPGQAVTSGCMKN